MKENKLLTLSQEFAAEITQAGIPCVECMGVRGGGMHCREEFAFISSLTEAAERLASVVLYI